MRARSGRALATAHALPTRNADTRRTLWTHVFRSGRTPPALHGFAPYTYETLLVLYYFISWWICNVTTCMESVAAQEVAASARMYRKEHLSPRDEHADRLTTPVSSSLAIALVHELKALEAENAALKAFIQRTQSQGGSILAGRTAGIWLAGQLGCWVRSDRLGRSLGWFVE